jgi:hypothetical protein
MGVGDGRHDAAAPGHHHARRAVAGVFVVVVLLVLCGSPIAGRHGELLIFATLGS